MSGLDVALLLLALVAGIALGAGWLIVRRRRQGGAAELPRTRAKVLFPFVGDELSERALQATLRLARAEGATVVPAALTTVPLPLALDAPVGKACEDAFAVFEAIEQRAAAAGVPVDARIARGRTVRHALRAALDDVPAATRVVVAAGSGFEVDDVAWLLRNAPGEVVVIRPAPAAAPATRHAAPAHPAPATPRPRRAGRRPSRAAR